MPRYTRLEDFTIGWICALPIELAAALAALDEEYERIPDVAQYTLGRIGKHGVAAICLPAGQLGTSAAAAVAVHMQRTFPALQYGLMVGIAGGVPSRSADIRLGDVVISHPEGRYGGVVQYDFGKTGPGGQHLSHGSLNSPHPILLQAVGTLRAVTMGGYNISAVMSSFKDPNLLIRPVAETDCFFEASYDHVPGDTCDQCLRDRLVQRTPRTNQNIVIHYGTVASGNKVIKDGATRDRLSAEHGGVLCFEMEAAGLMNVFPCLIVRGICDYADSHKNKSWQPFAAAMAAVCAKAVLSFVPSVSRSVDGSSDTCSTMSKTCVPESPGIPNLSSRPATKKVQDPSSLYLESSLTAKDLNSYHKSLRFDEIDARHATIRDAHSETCGWLLQRQEYQDWLASDNLPKHHGIFWIKGHPGSGKSTIMKFALQCTARENADTTFIKFFFNARGHELEKSVLGMYRSLLFQLLDKHSDLKKVFALHCSKLSDDKVPPAWHADILQSLFGHAVERLGPRPLMCFIDALDECEEDQVRAMMDFFEHLGDIAVSSGLNFRTCFSSRHYPNITIEHGILLTLEKQQEHSDDIAKYVRNKLGGEGQLLKHVRKTICERSSGIFLWVVLVVQILRKDFDRGEMHVLERRLKEIPNGTDELFNDMLTRDNENVERLILCLQWILFARQPLKPIELFYGVTAGIDPDSIAKHDSSYIDEDALQKFLLNSSKGLAELTTQTPQTVQFIHETVREYLLKVTCPSIFPAELASNFSGISQERLKLCCEAYIAAVEPQIHGRFPKELTNPSEIMDQDDNTYRRYPFLEYAEDNILHHAEEAAEHGLNQEEFVGRFVERFAYCTWTMREKDGVLFYRTKSRFYSVSPLYVFASQGFANLVKIEVARARLIDIEGGRYGFPLNAAIALKSKKTLDALLVKSDDYEYATMADTLYLTPGRREAAIKDALNADVPNGKPLLCWAAQHGKIDLVKVLLCTHKVDLNIRDNFALPTMHIADAGDGGTPLIWAARMGHATVVNLLLKIGQVDVESKDDRGLTALSSAAQKGHDSVVKSMLGIANVNIESKDRAGRTALSYTAGNGHEAVVRLLMATYMVDVESKSKYGRTVLSYAAGGGNEAVVRLLMATEMVDVESKCSEGQTVLSYAAGYGHKAVVTLLLATEMVDIESKDVYGRTPLAWAAAGGHASVLKLLFGHWKMKTTHQGMVLDTRRLGFHKDHFRETPLYGAVRANSVEVVEFLLSIDEIDLEAADRFGQTALDLAREIKSVVLMELLMQAQSNRAMRALGANTLTHVTTG